MGKTITVHNGNDGKGQVSQAHNRRDKNVTEALSVHNEGGHIDLNLCQNNEYLNPVTWKWQAEPTDIPARKAYKTAFGEALAEYNAKQTRPERVIKDFYDHTRQKDNQNAVYELIYQIGDKNDTGIDVQNTRGERDILKDVISSWKERNPHLMLIGAYLHADEVDGTLHAHVDYIPVATGYKTFLSTQPGLNKALSMQGILHKSNKDTPQMQFQNRERDVLERACIHRDIEVVHPMAGKNHVKTELYKANKALERAEGIIKQGEDESRKKGLKIGSVRVISEKKAVGVDEMAGAAAVALASAEQRQREATRQAAANAREAERLENMRKQDENTRFVLELNRKKYEN
ncbi:MAG: plasmid recombination protein, partial [Firmicutes bacterium]|nr:plasmid recombination protein [Bacillota bacterium]